MKCRLDSSPATVFNKIAYALPFFKEFPVIVHPFEPSSDSIIMLFLLSFSDQPAFHFEHRHQSPPRVSPNSPPYRRATWRSFRESVSCCIVPVCRTFPGGIVMKRTPPIIPFFRNSLLSNGFPNRSILTSKRCLNNGYGDYNIRYFRDFFLR